MTVTLTPEQEALIKAEIEAGRSNSAEEVITKALEILRAKNGPEEGAKVTDAERAAVQELLKMAKERSVHLDGISIKELINEGRRF